MPNNFQKVGEIVVDWYPSNQVNAYGVQTIIGNYGSHVYQYIRSKRGNEWNTWEEIAAKSDLTGFVETNMFTVKTVINGRGIVTSNGDQPLALYINQGKRIIGLYLNGSLIGEISYNPL